uniref:Putative mastermind-like domain-containing protein 1 isoform X1 n=1 Tax=Davidia involucrata TaxID=16924 RepID=A0A5B7AB96_DAVIN
MGKVEQQLHLQQQIQGNRTRRTDSTIFCERCSMGLSRIGRECSFKCVVVLILSVSLFLSAIFWAFPLHSTQSEFDAKDAIKLSATVQAYFRLQKPVSVLVPRIARLEYDIYGEIGVPFTKVAILSMHRASTSNWTNVVFGVLSDPIDVSINSVFLSVLRSSLIELFLQQSNLSLTTSIFGQPSSFEILKFPGGITVIPVQSASIWQIPQILFNFTLYNSIYEIKENLVELEEQLKLGLHLRPYENVYVQVTNKNGSTRDPPVTVQVSVMSDLGSLLPQRLKQLAQTITGSPPAKNLGLNNSVFGKVKEISLSTYLNRTFHATPPTSSPAPSPEQNDYAEPSISPYPALSPSYSPAPSPDFHHLPPCFNCDSSSPSDDSHPYAPSPESRPHHSLPPIPSSPAPSMVDTHPSRPRPHCGYTKSPSPSPTSFSDPTAPPTSSAPASTPHPPPMGPTPQLPPDLSPLPVVSYGSGPVQDKGNGKGSASPPLASPSISPYASSFTAGPSYKEIWLFGFFGLVTFHLLCWS